MFLEKKLSRWLEAGVIDEATKTKILQFENQDSKSTLLTGILSIGALSIIVGIISIIAANWELIPKYLKLSSNMLWLILLGFGISKLEDSSHRAARETLILIFFGSIIGSIGLIGQVYHLESHFVNAFGLWLAIGTPIILKSETKYAAHAWALVFAITVCLGHDYLFPEDTLGLYGVTFEYVPLFLIYVAILFQNIKIGIPHFQQATFRVAAFIFFVTYLLLGSNRWGGYNPYAYYKQSLLLVVFAIPIAWYLNRTYSRLAAIIFLSTVFFLELPHFFTHGNYEVIGALFFVMIWSMIGYLGIKLNRKRLFEFSCLVVAFRIIVIYFQVFGSLLQTGLGLVGSGVFILLIAYLWHSKKEKLWKMSKV